MSQVTTTDLVRRSSGAVALQRAHELGAEFRTIGMDITNPDLSYDEYEEIGRILGDISTGWRWNIGDWLIVGEALFGEEAAQAIDDRASRYDLARRVTGLDQGTLQNIRSVCSRVPRENRRSELDFTHHTKVASLEPDEQAVWLQKAIDETWSTSELAAAIKDEKHPDGTPPTEQPQWTPEPPEVSLSELRDEALALVYRQAQPLSDGDYRLPAEVYARVGAALGEK